jgi:hypothetical protein
MVLLSYMLYASFEEEKNFGGKRKKTSLGFVR